MRAAPVLLSAVLGAALPARADVRADPLRAPRVRTAHEARGAELRALFAAARLPFPPRGVLLRAFKEEKELELWGAGAGGEYALVKRFPICASSGSLGPKRREGDLQVPEGFYTLSQFNPQSRFHLSLGVSYPNASDRILGEKGRLGGAIFIHGACVTIGCVPLTDAGIELVYLAALEARAAGQREIPVHLFPARLTDGTLRRLRAGDPAAVALWRNLKEGYDLFERDRRPPRVRVDSQGRYHFATGR
jgi:murein L,D-transpeptidase YafK